LYTICKRRDRERLELDQFKLFGIQVVNPPNEEVIAVAPAGNAENDLREKTFYVKSG